MWRQQDCIALDTEFIRTSTFYPKVGLIQVNGNGTSTLIDPLAVSSWDSFLALMQDTGVVKIFHSCSEDIQVFMAAWRVIPRPVFDTQVAAAFLNEGFGCSYQALVGNKMDLELPKGETRSDWLQRPLAESQLHYAALDVAYLPEIYAMQRQGLRDKGRLAWLEEECAMLLDTYATELDGNFDDAYLAVKGAWQLNRRQLGMLKTLATWRENRARTRDKPRNWIVRDKGLVDLAVKLPQSQEALKNIPDLDRNFMRYESEEVLSLIRDSGQQTEDSLPPLLPRPLNGRQKQRLRHAQQFVEIRARELDLPVEMLARKRWLQALLQNMIDAGDKVEAALAESLLPAELSGWRRELLLPGLLEAIR